MRLLLFNFFGMFAWWGLFTWLPPYLSLPVEQGGRGFGVMGMTTLMVVLNLCGMFPGYASFGWVADHLGRRKAFLVYTLIAALLIPLYAVARSQGVLLVLGTLVAFFGTGIFSGSGIMGSEIFPTAVRARALGFTYNGARTHEFGGSAGDWTGRPNEGIELGLLSVRGGISAGGADDDAVAGDEGEEMSERGSSHGSI